MGKLLSSAFHHTALETRSARDCELALLALSVLLQHGAKPHHEDLTLLAHVVSMEKLDECFFRALSSAKNSFIAGSNISFALDDAMEVAQEAERKLSDRTMSVLGGGILQSSPSWVRGGGGVEVFYFRLCSDHSSPSCKGLQIARFSWGT